MLEGVTMADNDFDHGGAPGCYFERVPEKLVLEGYRRWMAGFETGSVTPWEMTYSLYTGLLGIAEGRRAISDLAHFVRMLRQCAACPLRSFPFGAHHVCRDECLALGLIAGLQHEDDGTIHACLSGMCCAGRGAELRDAGACLADTLVGLQQYLLPIPRHVIEDILDRAGRATIH
jgi:hypothetical protein